MDYRRITPAGTVAGGPVELRKVPGSEAVLTDCRPIRFQDVSLVRAVLKTRYIYIKIGRVMS